MVESLAENDEILDENDEPLDENGSLGCLQALRGAALGPAKRRGSPAGHGLAAAARGV